MSLFGPVTNADRRGWQRRDAAALAEMLDAADKADLPPLIWQVGMSGLVGRCMDRDPAARRGEFEAWARFLGEVELWPEHRTPGGTTHLHAGRRGYGPRRVDVTVIADIHDEDAADEVTS
jgi:hypothetical protein